MVLGLVDQLQILQLHLIEWLGFLSRSGAIQTVARDVSKAFDWVWHDGLLHKRKILWNFRSDIRLYFFFSQKQTVSGWEVFTKIFSYARAPQGSILSPTLFLLYINDFPDDVICDIAIYADDTTLYSKCDQASDLWQQLELASELESDLRDTVDWGKKWVVDFNAGKTQLVLFDWSNNAGAIDVEMEWEDKSSFKMLGLTFSSKLD